MFKVKAYTLLLISFILFLVSGASAVALVIAFTSKDTLAAVESVFGTSVIIICLLMLGVKVYFLGKSYLAESEKQNNLK